MILFFVLFFCLSSSRFYFGDFEDLSYLKLNGNTTRDGKCLSLTTPGISDQVGTFWYTKSLSFDSKNGFFTTFHFRITRDDSVNNTFTSRTLLAYKRGFRHSLLETFSDQGLAFVLQSSGVDSIGQGGSQLGYGGLQGKLAVEFDVAMNLEERDPNNNHISVHLPTANGRLSSYETNAMVSADKHSVSLDDGNLHTVEIKYTKEVLSIYFDDLITPVLVANISLNESVYAGFTATTSNGTSGRVEVCDWYYEGTLVTDVKDYQESCDEGFSGPHCQLNSIQELARCEHATVSGCVVCASTSNCAWCKADQKCILATAHPACSDSESVIDNYQACLSIPKHARMFNLLFVIFFTIAMVLVSIAKLFVLPILGPQYETLKRRTEIFTDLLIASTVGALFSVIIYYLVNRTLILISTNTFYAFFIGLSFLFTGLVVFYQTLAAYFEVTGHVTKASPFHFFVLFIFCLILIASGVVCFILEHDWAIRIPNNIKTVLYTLLGTSVCFSTVHGVIDGIHWLTKMFNVRLTGSKPLVQSTNIVRLLCMTASFCGLYYGWVFGFLDLEDVSRLSVEVAFQQEGVYCYPLAACLGAFFAFYTHYTKLRENLRIELKYLENQGDDL